MRKLISKHPLSICCYIVFLLIWLYFLWARGYYHSLYDTNGQINAQPMERAFYGLVLVIAAALVLFLIALVKAIRSKDSKEYYIIYAGLIAFQMLALCIYIKI